VPILQGEEKIYECTFVETDVVPDCKYFATKCRLGKAGVEEVLPLPELSTFEQGKLKEVKAELNKNIKTGEDFAKSKS
jgi:malate dehydrogenase